jgi:16S rRNA (uracil1498-N3)-methyltransferase
MQRYFVKANQINNNLITIIDKDAHHIKDVMRFKHRDLVIVNTEDGDLYQAKIIEFTKKEVILEITSKMDNDYKPLNLVLGISLIKKDNFELILQKTTELGIRKIIPLKTERSIIKIDDFDKKKLRYQTIVKEASEQSERTILPIIADETEITNIDLSEYDYKFICFARENSNLINNELKSYQPNKKALVLIGPEGGFSPSEITKYLKLGFTTVSLGKTILRAETAAIYVTSLFRYLEEVYK